MAGDRRLGEHYPDGARATGQEWLDIFNTTEAKYALELQPCLKGEPGVAF